MQNRLHQALSLHEAAKIIYATKDPTEDQLERVRKRLESGVLAGTLLNSRRPSWRTTPEAVAKYMAAQAYQSQVAAISPSGAATGRYPAKESNETQLGSVCREILKDYFEAMIFRRRARRAGKWFQGAVVAGQLAALAMLLVAVTMAYRNAFPADPPEHAVIARWIEDDVGDFQLIAWHPSASTGGGVCVRVEYRYFAPGGKAVHTDRRFVVEGGRVVGVDSN